MASQDELFTSPALKELAQGRYCTKAENAIQGTGYVVRSLEAALWSFWVTESYEQAVLRAANLGQDADTTAAICGQLAGAYYGETKIPKRWRGRLVKHKEIRQLAERLYHNRPAA